MLLKIKCESDKIKGMYENHGHFHDGDSGLDLYFPNDMILGAGETHLIDLGFKCDGGMSFWVVPRSSISKTPLRMANSVGLIDKLYRGSIKVCVDNRSGEDYEIKEGDRLFQIVNPQLSEIKVEVVESLTETTRGDGGFGSTGK